MAKKKNTSTPVDYPLVALDMGSSSFKAMSAQVRELEENLPLLTITGYEQSSKYVCTRKGLVINTSHAGYMIREVLHLLANRLGRQPDDIPAAYTCLGGHSMGVTTVPVHRKPGVLTTIGKAQQEEMIKECKRKVQLVHPEMNLEAISVLPIYFDLDGERSYREVPLASRAKDIQAIYSAFYAPANLREDVEGSFARANKMIPDYFPRPVALLEALASEDDEKMGLAIIDFGAETTTVTIYKDGQYLTNKVIPCGGHNISMDVQQLGISFQHAEALKCRYGMAAEKFLTDNPTFRVRAAEEGAEPVKITRTLLTKFIHSRLDEILQEVAKVLKPFEDVIAQVYITGGASKLAHLEEVVQEYTTLPVSYGSHADWLDENTPDEYYAPEYSALVGTLLLGYKHKKKPGSSSSAPQKVVNKFFDPLVTLFSNTETE